MRSTGCYETSRFTSPAPRSIDGFWTRGEKISLMTEYVPWMREQFSGYLAIDEIYDGPLAILYAVDPKMELGVWYRILDEVSKEEVRKFFIQIRFLVGSVKGVTTDGSPLYPEVLQDVFPHARHQICRFHCLMDLNKAILKVLTGVRRGLAARVKKLKRGRPRAGQGAQDDPARRLKKDLFDHRTLWVKRRLSARDEKILKRLCRGRPLLRDLRKLADLVYDLFDRRCRRETALRKLARLRSLRTFGRHKVLANVLKKIRSKNLEQALWFLDDKMLESTSNAVERRNRRHRKFQKTVYRVRAKKAIDGRIKHDFLRDKKLKSRKMALAQAKRLFPGVFRRLIC